MKSLNKEFNKANINADRDNLFKVFRKHQQLTQVLEPRTRNINFISITIV